jgi:hypothetical protein
MKEEITSTVNSFLQNVTPHTSTPWLFEHQELFATEDTDRPLELKKLINKLNYINFTDGHIFFLLKHRDTGAQIMIKAYPQPCIKNELVSRLESPDADASKELNNYEFNYLMIDAGLTTVLAQVQFISLNDTILKTSLPDISRIKTLRKIKRFSCHDLSCKIIQGDFNAPGQLFEFSSGGLGVSISGSKNIKGFDETKSALLNIHQNGTQIYSGLCQCIHHRINISNNKVVFLPLPNQFSIFPKRESRNSRQHVGPSFSVSFQHPFFKGYIEKDIFDISQSGFSIIDKMEEDVLLPGMLIPNISILYAGIVKMMCSAQVVYRLVEQETNMIKYGLAISDMTLDSFTNLSQILGISNDSYARISTEVEMDSLWEFFFDTGFIYGEKYENIQSYRNTFKELYRKLYHDNSDIARHILYKKNGKIYGHIAMVHAYEPSWLIHHFAARRMSNRLPGMAVLKHIFQYAGSYTRLPSAGMNHVMTYYQPTNGIIERIFGNFTRYLNDSKKASVDVFSYMLFHKEQTPRKLPDDWVIRESTLRDMSKLKDFYEPASGGLLLSALGLDVCSEALKKSFADAGFIREYRTYCLCYQDRQMAFFIVNQSDIKLNLSDLMNGIKIIILEPDILSWAMLAAAVNALSGYYSEASIPLLIFPSYFLSVQNITVEKQYALWILHSRACDDLLVYMNRLINLQSRRR